MKKRMFLYTGLFFLTIGCSVFKKSLAPVPKPQMVPIPGGTFVMGDIYGDNNPDAKPVHQVTLSNFEIGKYEVTYEEYDAFAKRTDRPLPHADSLNRGQRAVVNVSWDDAQAFCEFHGWRLPTEQEWEYAARSGGKKTRFSGTKVVDSLDAYARTKENSGPFSFKVGTKEPNRVGLFDMSGNVYEWIGSYYQFYPENGENPEWDSLEERSVRIIRGGSFKYEKVYAATYWRVGILKEADENDIGFRCVNPLKDK